jgi:predicted RNA-binding Zn-ribbon protein involved in translation (DUF1610 family)
MDTILLIVLVLFGILFFIGCIRIASEVGKVAGAFAELVLRASEESRPSGPYRVAAFPFDCPNCGVRLTHIVCRKCGASYNKVGRCPHCGRREKTVSCPECSAVFKS